MKLALDRLADNPIIDELLCWVDHNKPIKSLRASATIWRKPFIEIEYQNSKKGNHMHFPKEQFIQNWSTAIVILDTLTNIKLISEFQPNPVENREVTVETILSTRDACIQECDSMFESGMYQVFINQFGPNCKDLPEATLARLKTAQSLLVD